MCLYWVFGCWTSGRRKLLTVTWAQKISSYSTSMVIWWYIDYRMCLLLNNLFYPMFRRKSSDGIKNEMWTVLRARVCLCLMCRIELSNFVAQILILLNGWSVLFFRFVSLGQQNVSDITNYYCRVHNRSRDVQSPVNVNSPKLIYLNDSSSESCRLVRR